jgi:hypothetical protein
MLLEAEVNRREDGIGIRDFVYDKPAGKCVTAASLSRPFETASRGIVERIALQVAVITGLKFIDAIHGLEIAGPFNTINDHAEVSPRGTDRLLRLRVGVVLTKPNEVSRIALEIQVIAGGGSRARGWLPESRGRWVDRPSVRGRVARIPVDLTVKRGGTALAELLEAEVNCCEATIDIGNIVDGKRAGYAEAPPSIPRPVQTSWPGILRVIALEVGICADLEFLETTRDLKKTEPHCVSGNVYGEVASGGADGDMRICWGIGIGFAGADEVSSITLQANRTCSPRHGRSSICCRRDHRASICRRPYGRAAAAASNQCERY